MPQCTIYDIRYTRYEIGSVPEWTKGMGCKPIGVSLRWFDSNPAQYSFGGVASGAYRITGAPILAHLQSLELPVSLQLFFVPKESRKQQEIY